MLVGLFAVVLANLAAAGATVTSMRDGAWSDASTWQGGQVPAKGDRVYVAPGTRVRYDAQTDGPLRSVQVAGVLTFADDRDTRLDVGLLLVSPGGPFDDDAAAVDRMVARPRDAAAPRLEIGTPDRPLAAGRRATIRLAAPDGGDALPAMIVTGGDVVMQGAPMPRPWLKLRTAAKAGDASVTLDAPAEGWRVGDRVIVVATNQPPMFRNDRVISSVREGTQTEERVIRSVEGQVVTLDRPLGFDHTAEGEFRGEVANLSRNVVIESADPKGARGHTMFHHDAGGSVAYVEFRSLGKRGVLGRYPLHFHQCGGSLRGFAVTGCAITDSDNRFVTLHGTQHVLLRDNVGYGSVGHGFFLEDGTEVYNVLDRNLAVQCVKGEPLPEQALAFDYNDGAGFWWANSLNTFTRNVAAECDQYGYRFEAVSTPTSSTVFPVLQPDGSTKDVDVRTLPFVRFEANEAHSMRRYAFNLGGFRLVAANDAFKSNDDGSTTFRKETTLVGDVGGVGPDLAHPFVIRNFRAWRNLWAFHSAAPSVLIDGLDVWEGDYGIWRTLSTHHQYKNVSMKGMRTADIYNPWGGPADFQTEFNQSIRIRDDRPPQTIVTRAFRTRFGELTVQGTTSDDRAIANVSVNGRPARSTRADIPFAEWTIDLTGDDASASSLTALATDAAGNVERTPHVVAVESPATRPAVTRGE